MTSGDGERSRALKTFSKLRTHHSKLKTTFVFIVCLTAGAAAQTPMQKGRLGLELSEITKPWTGDLDAMVERRMIRVLTAYSKTQYFIDNGTPRGTAYDQGKLLEDELNKKLPVR